MKRELEKLATKFLDFLGAGSNQQNNVDYFSLLVIVLVCAAAWFVLRFLLVKGGGRIASKSRSPVVKLLFDAGTMRKVASILTLLLLYSLIPVAFDVRTRALVITQRSMAVLIVCVAMALTNALIKITFRILYSKRNYRNRPLKGIQQVFQVINICIGIIIIVSIIIDKSPSKLLTGLGASAALLTLIFRNTILGLVSGVMLSEDRMLQPGDWISMPQNNVDGTVMEVTLNTVKIQNFDNTTTTIPPYVLTEGSFKNWNSMTLSGGRRIMRSINIDINSVRFCTDDMLTRFGHIDLLKDYLAEQKKKADEINSKLPSETPPVNRYRITNLGVFRAYLTAYLRSLSIVNKDMTLMVRYLEPTDSGIPVQVYCFSSTTEWVAYEGIQADIFDHIMAIVPQFDLTAFQKPSGADINSLAARTDDTVS